MNKVIQIALCVIGSILIMAGLLLYGLYPLVMGGPIAIALGILVLIVCIVLNRKELKNLISVRSAKYGTNTFIFVGVILLILLLINIVAERFKYKLDLTSYKSNSLSKQSLEILQDLDDKIKIYAFIDKNSKQSEIKKTHFLGLCDLYIYNSGGKVSCEIINPDRKPHLARKYHVSSNKGDVYGFESPKTYTVTDFLMEEEFTSAIIRVEKDIKKNIYFINGHEEGSISLDDKKGFTKLSKKLKNLGYRVHNIFLNEIKSIPDDISVLVILSPKKNLFPQEIDKINEYLLKGGSILMLIDPLYDIGINDFLADWGLKLENNIVIDKLSFLQDPFVPVVSNYVPHPITENSGIMLSYSFYNEVRSVKELPEIPKSVNVKPLFTTSGVNSYGEYNIKEYIQRGASKYDYETDKIGPLALSYVSEKNVSKDVMKPIYSRMLLVGDSNFANNESIDYYSNGTLILNMINWLSGDEDIISIDRPASSSNIISLSNQTKKLISYICIILFPFLLLLSAGVLWWRKRK